VAMSVIFLKDEMDVWWICSY